MRTQGLNDRDITGWARDDEGAEHGIERIIVALDPSAHSVAALEAAVSMAARFEAELQALFVEDVNIRRLTELTFVQEVGLYTASCRRVEVQELSRQLSVQAGRMRRRFGAVTRRVEARCTFRQIRGHVASEVLEAAAEADVVILGKGAWSPFETERLAPPVRQVLVDLPASSLVLRAGTEVKPPIRVVYTGTSVAEKALSIAARLAGDGHILVFIPDDNAERTSELRERARERLDRQEVELMFRRLTEASASRLAYLVAQEEDGTLVLPADAQAMEDEGVLDFLESTSVPVLLIR